ncbi:RNA recognition motif domain - like 6 [Theobroma cacao]|nr:RNA recognition motif domain - like 6 [Theobroma cacao]
MTAFLLGIKVQFCLGGTMRPVFVGNFEYETRQSELERLFSKYGRIERELLRENELLSGLANFSAKNFYCNGKFPACLLYCHSQMASSCIFFTRSCYSPSSLAGGDLSNYHVMPTTIDYRGSLDSVMPCLLPLTIEDL